MGFLDELVQANRLAKAERDRRKALKAWARSRQMAAAARPRVSGDGETAVGADHATTALERAAGNGQRRTPAPDSFTAEAAAELAKRPSPRSAAALSPGGASFAVLIGLLILWPFLLPAFDQARFLQVQEIIWFAIVVAGLNIVAGYAGQLSLGQKIFWLIGGYTVAVLTTQVGGFLGDPWIAMVVAVLISTGAGAVLGLPALRVKGAYLAIVTLAFVPIFFRIFAADTFKGVFNGLQGIADVATPVGNPARPPVRVINFPFTSRAMTDIDFYLFTVTIFALLMFFARNIVKSRWGRAMTAIRESEVAAKSSGVRVYRVKVAAFMISAAYASLGGILATYNLAFVSPQQSPFVHIRDSFTFVVMMIVGGTGTLAGPIAGAVSIQIIRQLTSGLLKFQTIILSVLAIFTVITAPTGQVGVIKDSIERRRAKKRGGRMEEIEVPPLPELLVRPRPRPEVERAGDVVLETKGMSKIFGGLRANDTVSIAVAKGSVHSLIGPNGSGKTTFINVVTGLYAPEEGEVWFSGERIDGKPAFVTVERGMGRTFQNLQLWRRMTVLENVMVGLHVRAKGGFIDNMVRTPRARREEAEIRARALGLLQFVGLDRYANILAGQLPYGPQRYLEIARALALDPILLILDEPAAGLNPAEVHDLMGLIQRIKVTGITVFLIEHHMDLVMGVSDQISVLDYGKKISEGTPEVVQADERVIEAYLGAEFAEAMAH